MPDPTDAILLTWPHPPVREALAGFRILEGKDGSALDERDRASIRVILTTGVQRIGAREMDVLPNLGLIVTIGAGFDGIDHTAASARGVELASGRGANADDVADLAIGLFLVAARQIIGGDTRVRLGTWVMREPRPVRSVGAMRIGIVGMGFIGRAIAARLAPFRCEIAWTGPRPKADISHRYVADLHVLASESDALILAAPLDAATAGMISGEVMAALGPEGVLVNVGRGGLVDEDALISALREGRLGAAALDVFVEEPTPAQRWRDVPNVVLSPHTAGITHESMAAVVSLAARRAIAFIERATPRRS